MNRRQSDLFSTKTQNLDTTAANIKFRAENRTKSKQLEGDLDQRLRFLSREKGELLDFLAYVKDVQSPNLTTKSQRRRSRISAKVMANLTKSGRRMSSVSEIKDNTDSTLKKSKRSISLPDVKTRLNASTELSDSVLFTSSLYGQTGDKNIKKARRMKDNSRNCRRKRPPVVDEVNQKVHKTNEIEIAMKQLATIDTKRSDIDCLPQLVKKPDGKRQFVTDGEEKQLIIEKKPWKPLSTRDLLEIDFYRTNVELRIHNWLQSIPSDLLLSNEASLPASNEEKSPEGQYARSVEDLKVGMIGAMTPANTYATWSSRESTKQRQVSEYQSVLKDAKHTPLLKPLDPLKRKTSEKTLNKKNKKKKVHFHKSVTQKPVKDVVESKDQAQIDEHGGEEVKQISTVTATDLDHISNSMESFHTCKTYRGYNSLPERTNNSQAFRNLALAQLRIVKRQKARAREETYDYGKHIDSQNKRRSRYKGNSE